MSRIAPNELLATFGFDGFAPLCVVYVFSLGPALLVGSSQLPGSATFAVGLWTGGAFIIALAAGFCFSRFTSDARDVLLPAYRHVLIRSVSWLLSMTLVLPIVLFWILVPGARHWILLPLAAHLGLVLPMMPRLSRFEGRSRPAGTADAPRYSVRSPSEAIGMFMGRPFSPVPTEPRALCLLAMCVVLWSVPLGLILTSTRPPWSDLAPLYLALTVILSWGWFMIGLAKFARNRSGSFAELALLPGLGTAASQRCALYRAALVRPLFIVACGLAGGMLTAWSAWHSPIQLARFSLGCAVLLTFCASAVFQLLNLKSTVTIRAAVLMQSIVPLLLAPTLLQSLPGQAWFSHPGAQRLFFVFVLMLTAVSLYTIWIYARGLARQPHPFLEMPS